MVICGNILYISSDNSQDIHPSRDTASSYTCTSQNTVPKTEEVLPLPLCLLQPGKEYSTVIYGKGEKYAIELVTMRNKEWRYIVDAHKSKRSEDPYDLTAYLRRILFFKGVSFGLSSDPTTSKAYTCDCLLSTNDICLHQNRPSKQKTTIWLYRVMFYRTSGYEETEVVDLLKRDFIIIG